MSSQKIVSLQARPSIASHLCCPIDGVVDVVNCSLGQQVPGFDYDAFCQTLLPANGPTPTQPNDPSRLLYDSTKISSAIGASSLLTLRSGTSAAAALDYAVNARQNSYFAKYAQIPEVAWFAAAYYQHGSNSSKIDYLQTLANVSTDQWVAVQNAYDAAGEGPSGPSLVETGTKSDINSSQSTLYTQNSPSSFANESSYETQIISIPVGGYENIVNQDFVFKTPYYEAQAQFLRSQISLNDQWFAEYSKQQNVTNLQTVLTNELRMIDLQIYQLQLAYLNTFVTSPYATENQAATVTGLYKMPGDAIKAGETAIRVENNAVVYLTGTIIYPGLISPGMTATLSTNLYDAASTPTSLSGTVQAVRGRGDDDTWDIVAICTNPTDATGNPVLPPEYRFDFDNTQLLSITP
jgi:hypothetical protein